MKLPQDFRIEKQQQGVCCRSNGGRKFQAKQSVEGLPKCPTTPTSNHSWNLVELALAYQPLASAATASAAAAAATAMCLFDLRNPLLLLQMLVFNTVH